MRTLRSDDKGSGADILSIVEAAYSVDVPAQQWSLNMLEAAERAVGAGMGGFVCPLHANTNGTVSFDGASAASLGVPSEMLAAILHGLNHTPPGWLSSHLAQPKGAAICVLTSEVDPEVKLKYREQLADSGVRDGINIVSVDLDGSGLLLSLGTHGGADLAQDTRQNLKRVATHILAAQRLRKRLRDDPSPTSTTGTTTATTTAAATAAATTTAAPAPDPTPISLDDADAVLSPDGGVLHANGHAKLTEARRALQTAVRNVEEARRSRRRGPDGALGQWKGLVFAQWTLVDRFNQDGTKYIVARENLPHASGLLTLTPTERCVVTYAARGLTTKEIAYTLGISGATVRVLLMRAARRCGVSSRTKLLRLCKEAQGTE